MSSIEVWVTDHDRFQASFSIDPVNSVLIEVGDTVPQHVSSVGLDEEAALPDGEMWLGGYTPHPRFDGVLIEGVDVVSAHLPQRRPGLARSRDELARVLC